MARKASSNQVHARGFGDIIGIALIAVSVLTLVALLSYDPRDVSVNSTEPNLTTHNWIGQVGAWIGFLLFFLFGAGAYLLPILLFCFGLSYLFHWMAYFHRRWVWATTLLLCGMGLLDLNKPVAFLAHWQRNYNATSVGGWVGLMMNKYLFGHFGSVGATIIFTTLYFISLLFLTNFQLGEWLRGLLPGEPAEAEKDVPDEDRALERRARELERQAKKLQEQVAKAGLGADLQPVPEPTVRDLSLPQTKPSFPSGLRSRSNAPEPETGQPAGVEGEVIPAKEIVAATAQDILGKPKEKAKEPKTEEPTAEPPKAAVSGKDKTVVVDEKTAVEALPVVHLPAEPPPKPRTQPKKPKPIAVAATPLIGNYQLPLFDLLNYPDPAVRPTESKEDLMANARLIQQTLAQFDIEVALGDITKGPTITRYELHPAPGVKLEKITALNNNIAAALKAERIHILAPVPGKSSVGFEVPNIIKTKVIIRDLLESEEWRSTRARIPLALGKDVYGHPIVADLTEMPHLLIAGSTGSGKSVCINAIITSLLYRFSPDQLRFVMIDPKVVELQQYNALPHLVVPVVTDPKKVILALRWVVNEMEKRYQIFARVGVRNIKSFNERPKDIPLPRTEPELPLKARKEKIEAGADGFAVEVDEEIVVPRDDDIVIPEKLSYIVVIIDELADLMLVAPADVEMAIARITQMARAAGIHCIVATQRPSVDVITGVIKANIPARIAFQVAAKVDSRTILDGMGADKLLGKGDMLYLPPGSAKFVRAQGALITDQETNRIVEFIARQGKPSYEMEIHQQLSKPLSSLDGENGIDEDEDLIQECIEVIRSEQKASVSLLQRRLRLGYTRAARIMDELENRGIVGPSKGAEPRDILIDLDGTGADGQGQ
ncbi:MAG: cell division protein FtsK [Verrucomicrobia bacterium]|nr:MAG: cell division protein FtsK [Verrucomicrobiota bacterium]